MPTAGLSLVAFMEQQQAINHLRNACIPADPSDGALIAEWNAAKAKRGAAIPNAGQPDIQPIPAAYQSHIQQLQSAPWIQPALQGPFQGATFHLVEIDKLLAFQFTIDTTRCAHHCAAMNHPPTLDELFMACLPIVPPPENIQLAQTPQSMVIQAKSLNVRTLAAGWDNNTNHVGIRFGVALPLVHVVRHNGRCYLHNGFHRALGVRMAGATHIPCMFRDVPDHESVGIRTDGTTFGAPLLESADPPTVAHFTQGRAYDVALRSFNRILHISWHEYAVATE